MGKWFTQWAVISINKVASLNKRESFIFEELMKNFATGKSTEIFFYTRGEGRRCSAGDSIVQAHRTPRITQPGGKTWLGKKEGMQLEAEATGR